MSTEEPKDGPERSVRLTAGLGLLPCPFCGGSDIHLYAQDNDSWLKNLYATCEDCGCMLDTKIDWKPFSIVKGDAEYKAAWKARISAKWNKRPNV